MSPATTADRVRSSGAALPTRLGSSVLAIIFVKKILARDAVDRRLRGQCRCRGPGRRITPTMRRERGEKKRREDDGGKRQHQHPAAPAVTPRALLAGRSHWAVLAITWRP